MKCDVSSLIFDVSSRKDGLSCLTGLAEDSIYGTIDLKCAIYRLKKALTTKDTEKHEGAIRNINNRAFEGYKTALGNHKDTKKN